LGGPVLAGWGPNGLPGGRWPGCCGPERIDCNVAEAGPPYEALVHSSSVEVRTADRARAVVGPVDVRGVDRNAARAVRARDEQRVRPVAVDDLPAGAALARDNGMNGQAGNPRVGRAQPDAM
jgi:hypothetical protein